MRKSKENETLKNDKNLDSNELARENVIKTIKGTEKVFDGIGNIFKSIWSIRNYFNSYHFISFTF